MKPAPFEMHRPRTLDRALELLERHGEEARLIAGGQSLVPMLNLRLASPAVLIDLNSVAGLAGIRHDGGAIHIGAGTRLQDLLESETVERHAPLLAAAVRHTGHFCRRRRSKAYSGSADDPSWRISYPKLAQRHVSMMVRTSSSTAPWGAK